MDDYRTEQRTPLIYYLRVFDRATQTLFGHVVDISSHGMLITSDKPMATRSEYHLALEDVSTMDHLATIDMSAECRWCQEDDAGELYDGGFRLIEPSDQLNRLLRQFQ